MATGLELSIKMLGTTIVMIGATFLLSRGTTWNPREETRLGATTSEYLSKSNSAVDFKMGEAAGQFSRKIQAGQPQDILQSFVDRAKKMGRAIEEPQCDANRATAWSTDPQGQKEGLMVIQVNAENCAVYRFSEAPNNTSKEFSSGLPAPPWGKSILKQQSQNGEKSLELFECQGSGSEIAQFYQQELTSTGWLELKDRNGNALSEDLLTFRRDDRMCFIQIQHGSEQSLITLVLDRFQP